MLSSYLPSARIDSWSSSTCTTKMATSPTAPCAARARSCCSAAMPAAAGGPSPCALVPPAKLDAGLWARGEQSTTLGQNRAACTWTGPGEGGRTFTQAQVTSVCVSSPKSWDAVGWGVRPSKWDRAVGEAGLTPRGAVSGQVLLCGMPGGPGGTGLISQSKRAGALELLHVPTPEELWGAAAPAGLELTSAGLLHQ